jgi:multiple sugar transport system permease protein
MALKESDCGVAMAAGSDAARNVSRIVLMDSDFASMPAIVAEGRQCINNLQRSSALFLSKTLFSAFAMLFFALFSDNGPVNNVLVSMGILKEPFRFLSSVAGTRGLVALMNFLMWFGNTTILLMAAVMGINPALFEAAELDGCSHSKIFFKITPPMIRPILVYVLITSMIGGLQMFDVPQILTNGKGTPDRSATTVIMYLNNHLFSKNYGMAGAVSVILFLICAVLCIAVYFSLNGQDNKSSRKKRDRFKPMGGAQV